MYIHKKLLDQKDDFREDWSSILLWKISYTYTNENPYCEACTAENMAYKANFGVAEVKPVALKWCLYSDAYTAEDCAKLIYPPRNGRIK
jgi:hypothetical protein